MKLGVLFSGGKDSTFAAWLAKKEHHELVCLISIFSENKESFMFHTPAIEMTKKQAELMSLPLLVKKTKGKKELELKDLENAIRDAKKTYGIEGVVTGAVGSVYQASRIQKICDRLGIECLSPLWQKPQIMLLEELLRNNFEVIIVGVFAFPLGKEWVGRKIDPKFIEDSRNLQEKYGINPAGEGGEFESLVIACPLFSKKLEFKIKNVSGEGNSWTAELE